MRIKKYILSGILSCSLFSVFSQEIKNVDPVLMSIDGKNISKAEFEAVYKKNYGKEVAGEKKTLNDYVNLFVNFKLKVREAEQAGLDTLTTFKTELAGYRKQLAAPYLTDKAVGEGLITEAYERMKTEIKASHILVKCAEDAFPKDTLSAYSKILEYRKRALKGEDFGKLAKESAAQGDPSASENLGDLGYFSSLQMVYTFENAAFATNVGEISMPVRTRFGYHIIKVFDKRPNQGEILTSHIMVKLKKEMTPSDSANAKKKIFEIYDRIKKGESFEDLAKEFSEDKQSAVKGGQLAYYGSGKMPVPEFEKYVFMLKNNGEYSEPFMTKYGWHIIKRIDKKEMPSFETIKNELKQKVNKDSRSQIGKSSLIAKIKKEYGFSEFKTTKNKVVTFAALDEFSKVIDSSYYIGKWKAAEKAGKLTKPMFTLDGKSYTQTDFAKYLESRQTRRGRTDNKVVLDIQYKNFVDESCIATEESKLESKYPEFKNLMQEYRDGILLFELTDRKVWSKGVQDSVGLKEFYLKNKEKYMWEERADVSIFKCADEKIQAKVMKMISKNKTQEEILKEVNKSSQLNLSSENIMYLSNEKTEDANFSFVKSNWKVGNYVFNDKEKNSQKIAYKVIKVNKIIPKTVKQMDEARGMITSDYQNYLEQEWLKSLKTNHEVKINEEVLKTIQ